MKLPSRQFAYLAAGAAALRQPFVIEHRPSAGSNIVFWAVSGALAALALSVASAAAGNLTIHTSTPKVSIHMPSVSATYPGVYVQELPSGAHSITGVSGVTPTYPGVYVQELPSGVHSITGVSVRHRPGSRPH
jgi:hypothetical protein